MINSQLRLTTAKDIGPLIWKPPSVFPRSAHLAQMRNFLAHKFGPGGVGSLALKPQSGASNDRCFGRFLAVSHQLRCSGQFWQMITYYMTPHNQKRLFRNLSTMDASPYRSTMSFRQCNNAIQCNI